MAASLPPGTPFRYLTESGDVHVLLKLKDHPWTPTVVNALCLEEGSGHFLLEEVDLTKDALVEPLVIVRVGEKAQHQIALAILQGDHPADFLALLDLMEETGRLDGEVNRRMHLLKDALKTAVEYLQTEHRYSKGAHQVVEKANAALLFNDEVKT
jgi:hypothetical protein